MIGYGTGEGLSTKDPALTLDRVRMEYIGSQALQLTGPRHLLGQQVGTAPNGTGFPFELADTKGGPIVLTDNFYRAVCIWGTRPAFALSFREARNDVVIKGVVVDNRQFTNSRGGVLFEGSKDFPRAVNVERLIVLLPNADKAPIQADYITHLRLVNCAVYTGNGKPIRITTTGAHPNVSIRIIGCVGNVDVIVNGVNVGPISQDYTL